MSDNQEFKCPGEIYVISAVVCKERQRRGWGKCRVCQFATLEEIVSIKPAPPIVDEKAEIRKRRYYLLR